MILWLHRLRRDEEGQTLLLAAIFGLVLMLCVLGTVNLGRAVYDKVQLQAAADSAAYSQAAVEARVLNFTAYTNRAMVVHYASVMAATAYLTWIHFLWAGMKPALQIMQFIPFAGVVFHIIHDVLQVLVHALDVAVALLTPILSAANLLLYGLQEGAWWSVYFGRLAQSMPPESHSGDSPLHPYLPIWPTLIPLANMAVFAQTRGHLSMPQNTLETGRILLNARNNAVQEARLHMLEVANSARQPWVAYGDRMDSPSISPLARRWRWKLWCARIGSVARTELGGFPPSDGPGSASKVHAQVWSGGRFQAAVECPLLPDEQVPIFTWVAMDQIFHNVKPGKDHYAAVWEPDGIVAKIIVKGLRLDAVLDAMQEVADQSPPNPDRRVFLLSPYVYFAARAAVKPGLGPTGALGNFAQPDVVIGLAKEGRDYNAEDGAKQYFGRKFTFNGRGGGKGTVDFRYTKSDWPGVAGLPLLHKGLNAFSAAQVYYHRPGDWKEQPNFFNPLWGARLMPVLESNAAAKLGFGKLPGLSNLLLH